MMLERKYMHARFFSLRHKRRKKFMAPRSVRISYLLNHVIFNHIYAQSIASREIQKDVATLPTTACILIPIK